MCATSSGAGCCVPAMWAPCHRGAEIRRPDRSGSRLMLTKSNCGTNAETNRSGSTFISTPLHATWAGRECGFCAPGVGVDARSYTGQGRSSLVGIATASITRASETTGAIPPCIRCRPSGGSSAAVQTCQNRSRLAQRGCITIPMSASRQRTNDTSALKSLCSTGGSDPFRRACVRAALISRCSQLPSADISLLPAP